MKDALLNQAIEKVLALKMKALDVVLDELVEPIGDIGNPEKVLGKPYESWTPQDLQLMTQVYGTQEPSPLSDLIFKKEYKRVRELEAQEKQI